MKAIGIARFRLCILITGTIHTRKIFSKFQRERNNPPMMMRSIYGAIGDTEKREDHRSAVGG
jgi:hypothetical protein